MRTDANCNYTLLYARAKASTLHKPVTNRSNYLIKINGGNLASRSHICLRRAYGILHKDYYHPGRSNVFCRFACFIYAPTMRLLFNVIVNAILLLWEILNSRICMCLNWLVAINTTRRCLLIYYERVIGAANLSWGSLGAFSLFILIVNI